MTTNGQSEDLEDGPSGFGISSEEESKEGQEYKRITQPYIRDNSDKIID